MTIKVVLFDLGGVLVELVGSPFPQSAASTTTSGDHVKDWFHSSIANQFERGQISATTFIERVQQDLNLAADKDEIKGTFQNWTRHLYPGVDELLDKLRSTPIKKQTNTEALNRDNDGVRHDDDDGDGDHSCYTLAILSNTNELHEPILMDKFGLRHKVEHIFLSHKLKCAKPEPKVFQIVLDTLQVEANSILFFDDNITNIQAARSLGFIAHHTKGIEEVKTMLQNMNIL